MFLVGFVQSRNTKAKKLLMSLIYSGSGYILIVHLFYKVLYFCNRNIVDSTECSGIGRSFRNILKDTLFSKSFWKICHKYIVVLS